MVKIAILEASHWHVPLYLKAFEDSGVEVVAVSDAEGAKGAGIAKHFSARLYSHYEELLQCETIDFAFVFGRHCDMLEMASAVAARDIAFAIEKPGGVSAKEIRQLKSLVQQKKLYVSVPFILRSGELFQYLQKLNNTANGRWDHMSFRFIAGPLERYTAANCGWMLEKELAAGGCTINLAVHFVDLIMKLTQEDIVSVSAQMIESSSSADVEIFSRLTLVTSSGVIGGIETGYTYPGGTSEPREFSFSMASDKHYIRSQADGLQVVSRDSSKQEYPIVEMNTDELYQSFARNSLNEFRQQSLPSIGLEDLERVMQVIDDAYVSARNGGIPIIL